MFLALGGLLLLVATVCQIIILIDAFKNAVWKGLLGFFCGFYLLYYAFVEFQNEKKTQIIAAWLGSAIVGGIFWSMGTAAAVAAQNVR